MDENPALAPAQRVRMGGRLREVVAMQHHPRTPGRGPGDLRRRREARHDDQRVDAGQVGVPGDALGVVAGGSRDHAALALLRAEQGQLVGGSALLERADRLQIVELEGDLRPGCARQRIREQGRRSEHTPLDARRSRADILQADHAAGLPQP